MSLNGAVFTQRKQIDRINKAVNGTFNFKKFSFLSTWKKYFNGLFEFCGCNIAVFCRKTGKKQDFFSRVITKWAPLQEDEKYTKKTSNSKTISKTLKCSNLKKIKMISSIAN